MSDNEAAQLHSQKRLLTKFLSKRIPHLPSPDERPPYPSSTANVFSKVFFWWLHPVMRTGYKRTLEPEDLFTLTDDIKVEKMAADFYRHFTAGVAKAETKHIAAKCKARGETPATSSVSSADDLADFTVSKYVTVWALFLTFKWQYSMSCLFLSLSSVGQTTNPLLTKKLITFVERRALGIETSINKGLGYSFGSCLVIMMVGIFINHFFYRSMLTGAQAKAVLTKAMLDKAFRLNAESKHKYSVGKITSIMGADLARVDFAFGFQPFLFTFPIPVAIAIAILVVNIGVAALVGVALVVLFLVFIFTLAKRLFGLRFKAMKFTDLRVNYLKEALNNLKVIKYYSWEAPYEANIADARHKEMKIIYKMQVMRNILIAVAMSLTLFSSMIAFLVLYAIRTGNRSPADIFSSISLFNVLSQQVILLPMALSSGTDALLGITRVGEFLCADELDPEELRIEADGPKREQMEKENLALEVQNASFEWETFDLDDNAEEANEKKQEKVAKTDSSDKDEKYESESDASSEIVFSGLHNIDLKIQKNEFVVITGLIGSGKSSLLSALSGFMKRTQGAIDVNGSLLLCGYPWVQNATVKENIIFGNEYDEQRYKDTIYACSLEADLDVLPGGDATEIGERGITLSGGQKARINLARAVYADKDIILLDDVLSAVDASVGKHIMNNCLLGMLKDKTRILATHQLSLISAANRVIFLNGDGSVDIGTTSELKERNPGFEKLMAFSSEQKDEEEDEENIEEELDVIEGAPKKSKKENRADEEAIHKTYKNDTTGGKLTEEEERAVNGIKFEVYANYANEGSGKVGPWVVVPSYLLLMILATFCQLFTNTWLSFWTEYKFKDKPDKFYIGIYVMFTVLSFVFLLSEFIVLVSLSNSAAINLNIRAVKRILHAPMSFMDTTPMGRILNRFTKDTDVLDNELGDQARFLMFTLSNIIGVLILCVIYLPWFAIALPFLGFLFVAVANFYQASAREIKRLEAIQRSFVYNNFNETLSGMPTIKAYNAEARFVAKSDNYLNVMNEAYYLSIANQRWLTLHMDILAAIFALLICLLCVGRVFSISPASVGLLLAYVIQIANQLSLLIRTFTQVENEMNSVERLSQYAFGLPEEAPYVITETTPKESWPEQGEITFKDVSMAYRPGLPLVLKDLSFQVKPAEKIGICGRTGAGKSSIMTALYRLTELEKGSIVIDGVDISNLGLHALRSKLSIIPQDPVLFRGSIRKNLDPFNERSDDKLWDALRRTGLIDSTRLEAVKKQVKTDDTDDESAMHKFHLDQSVEDDGSNFSLGERQLIAFARALVRDSKILILDEATSSVDYETDSKIQETIIREFSQCTILCIAHRLKTIINYNRILVLDKGELQEYDTPINLFNTDGSIFQQMCERSNITEEDFKDVQNF
ncbi:uncharacterized protein CANTADRAFT_19963 [Suhomyces tanzawaensis NRRL Y-17324]|uniref:P-loop containing nucleoside triphosphate hydrolase protein n=1 Tax=Suhomyces tanzawaensis NRRL Y-17324 TaxID=984487 RepID=A0A1E4SSB3_9ASCO|nr:uncharacterized protein CANTADRAFT_19963 [Suhomyces tanzawaensis NRRL Y-17324]ODV82409.1 hypothetical protein CANTADRAFT_19963 [Suhomyces tanzawaensis NRRL Y-17324]